MMRACNVDEASTHAGDPWDVFTQMAILIMEGRLPGGQRGYHSGPHCPLTQHAAGNKHVCDPSQILCLKVESLFRQLKIMWGVGVGVTVEVLVAPECPHGAARCGPNSIDTTTAPDPLLTLIEQWNFKILNSHVAGATSSGRSLIAAVRSFLHFSQLSAWLSVSRGYKPPHVIYRLAVANEAFLSKFTSETEQHNFPVANLALNTAIKVMVETLPRRPQVPVIGCLVCEKNETEEQAFNLANHKLQNETSISTSMAQNSNKNNEIDLRRTIMKGRLTESARSESPDLQLGESLLDPPHSLARLPRRFQSPSRSGSPSMETPEHIICRVKTPGPSPGRPPDIICPTALFYPPPNETRFPAMSYSSFQPSSSTEQFAISSFNRPVPKSNSAFSQVIPSLSETPCSFFWSPLMLPNSSEMYQSSTTSHSCCVDSEYSGQKAPSNSSTNNESRYVQSSTSNGSSFSQSSIYNQPTAFQCSGISKKEKNMDSYSQQTQIEVKNGKKYSSHYNDDSKEQNSDSQGMKRKGAYAKESPRNKRESPPSVYYSKEGKGQLDLLESSSKMMSKEDPLKRKSDEDHITQMKNSFKKREMVNDRPGKHYCSSIEDLTNISPIKSSHKQALNIKTDRGSKIDDMAAKMNFDLTPKETQEILSVLRHNTPVPPLRIGQHRKSTEQNSYRMCLGNEVKFDSHNSLKACHRKELKKTGKSEEDATAISSNNTCDTNFKKLNCLCKSTSKICKSSCSSFYPEDSKLNDDVTLPIEAKTVCQKLKLFTANSQPLKTKEQTSQTLIKSSLSSILSSIKNVSIQSPSEEDFEKCKARRALSFNDVQKEEVAEDREVEEACRTKGVPSTSEKFSFRRSLDSAAHLVFHCKTGLPLTSSPAPLRRGTSFDFDCTLNSVAAIRSALRTSCEEEDDSKEDDVSSPGVRTPTSIPTVLSASAPATVTCSNLLGSFEECVLNGRLEPVSTVHGFKAEIAASGAFCPKHTSKPVTVFFYTLCDNDQISSPYMGHINLGKKGYHVPCQGTLQVTLFNPHGTVVKMFVVMYDLSDMPPNSKTFLRQRTLNMPVGASESHPAAHQWLRYLIHLRFASSNSGKIYLHTDIRLLIFRKCDADAATLHKNIGTPYELRSFTNGPSNPKFSPRK